MGEKEDRRYLRSEIDILEYIYILKRNKILFFGTWIFFLLSSITLQFTLPKYYETQAIIRGGALCNLTKKISDVRLILQSKKTLDYAVKECHLRVDLRDLGMLFQDGMLKVETTIDSNIIRLKSRNTNPQMAAETCNAIAKSFVVLENRRYLKSRFMIHRRLEQYRKEKDAILVKISELGWYLSGWKADVAFLQNQIDIYNGILKDISARILALEEMYLLYSDGFEILEYASTSNSPIDFLPRYFVISMVLLGLTSGFFLVSLREFWVNYSKDRVASDK